MIGTNLAITTKNYAVAGGVTYDADAQAYFTANTAITSDADKNAINTFYLGLKSDGIYTKIKAMYLPIWGSAAACKWNLKDPRDLDAAFRLTFTTGWTYSSSGITPLNAYATTFLQPNTNFNTTDYNHLSFYSGTSTSIVDDYVMGALQPGRANLMIIRDTSNFCGFYADYNTATYRQCSLNTNTDGRGFYVGTQNGTSIKIFKNNTLLAQNTGVSISGTPPIYSIVIGAVNSSGTPTAYSNKQCRFASIGTKLSDTEATNFYTRVNTLMTYFGINV